jgi:hypothetical protein
MLRYECTLPEYHDDDEWIEIEAALPEIGSSPTSRPPVYREEREG